MIAHNKAIGLRKIQNKFPHIVEALSRVEPIDAYGNPFPMRTLQISIPITLFSRSAVFTFSFEVPFHFDYIHLHNELKLISTEIITNHVNDIDALKSRVFFDEPFDQSVVTDKLLCDQIECILVPRVGRAVYESRVPFFRYRVTVQRKQEASNEDVEMGDIL
jgi:hypothetical protein